MMKRLLLLLPLLFAGAAHAALLKDETYCQYANTAALKSNTTDYVSWTDDGNEVFNPNLISLDTSDGYVDCGGGVKKSMLYSFPATNSTDYTIGTNFVIGQSLTDVWLEVAAKYGANFRTDNPGGSGNADYKFLFGRAGTGRFHLMMGTYGDAFSFSYPPNTAEWIGGNASQFFDGNWHVYRWHMKTGSSGANKLWIDGTVIYNFGTVNAASTTVYGIALGRNQNRGFAQATTLRFGRVRIYNSDPGWDAPDTTAPTTPTNFNATANGPSAANLSWTASTDAVGVSNYIVERCLGASCVGFAQIATPTGTTYADSGLTASTTYRYRIAARDAANNTSTYSSIASITTSASADATPPTAPSSLVATATGQSSVSLAWTASTDNVGVTGYQIDRCQALGCSNFVLVATSTTNSATQTGLTAATAYGYRVRATDLAGNFSGYSNTATVTTNAAATRECPSDWATLHPTWIWCDDFEDNKLSNYFDADWTNFVRTAAVGYGSSYGMRTSLTPSRSDSGSLKVLIGPNPVGTVPAGVKPNTTTKFSEIYWRVFVNQSSNWVTANTSNKLARATVFSDSNWGQAMVAHFWSGGTGNLYLMNDPASCVAQGATSSRCTNYNSAQLAYTTASVGTTQFFADPHRGVWKCVEGHVKLNSTNQLDAVQEFWIGDAGQATPPASTDARSSGFNYIGNYTAYGINAFFIETYMNDPPSVTQTRDWDNLVIATTRIGCSVDAAVPPPLLPAPSNIHWRPVSNAWPLWFADLSRVYH